MAHLTGGPSPPLPPPHGTPTTLSGDVLLVTALTRVGLDVAEPVWGHLVRDRVGNALFGQNTLGSGIAVSPMSSGSSLLRLEFAWPEVEEGESNDLLTAVVEPFAADVDPATVS